MPLAELALGAASAHGDYYFFQSGGSRGQCLLFFPGGRVKAEAYAPYLQRLAENGLHGFLLRPSLELAPIDLGVALAARQSDLAARFCDTYLLAGHSLGGIAAVSYARKNPQFPLLLISAYVHESGLEEYPWPVMLVYGEHDQLVVSDIKESRDFAPPQTEFRIIEGGNHAYMGYYGEQDGDGQATISRSEQQQQLLALTLEWAAGAAAEK